MKNNLLSWIDRISPLVLACALTCVYLATLAPGLTWANNGADGGDLIAAAATGGVAHPTGYPVYLILARLFQRIPIGSLAYRTNLLSALAMVCASLVVYALVKRYLDSQKGLHSSMPALISGFAFGLSSLAWSQAVITEVYALNAFFVAAVIYLSVYRILNMRRGYEDAVLGLMLGLGLGVHATIIFLIPIALLVRSISLSSDVDAKKTFWKGWQLDWKSAFWTLLWIMIGLIPYLLLPVWASSHPPIDWGDPVTWGREWWLVSGQLYRGYLFSASIADVWIRLQLWAGFVTGQFGLLGLCIGLLGLTIFFLPSRLFALTIWGTLVYSLFAINYNTEDWYIYLISVFLCFAIWIGVGMHGLMNLALRSRRWPGWVVGIAVLFYLFALAAYHWPQVDASNDLRAETFGREVLTKAPENAFVFVQGDQAIFAMWYFRFALHERADLVVVAPDLLSFAWYQDVIRSTYPQLSLPKYFPWPIVLEVTNPSRPFCYVQSSGQTEISCFSQKSFAQ